MRKKNREITDRSELESIFKKADVCRIAINNEGAPYIVAMNFGYQKENGCLYFHCAGEGLKLDLIRKDNRVGFQLDTDHELIVADKACKFSMNYKSIVGSGKMYIIGDNNEKQAGLDVLMKHYSDQNEFSYDPEVLGNTTVLRLDIEQMTGKKLQKY